VNKSDRPDADAFVKNLRLMLAPVFHSHTVPVEIIKTVAATGSGVQELAAAIARHQQQRLPNEKKTWLLAERAYYLIQQVRMKDVSKEFLRLQILSEGENFNLYAFVRRQTI
jgi:LAO/AO transport system kinase